MPNSVRDQGIRTIIQRTMDLLNAQVWVMNRDDIVIASSDAHAVGHSFGHVAYVSEGCLRASLDFHDGDPVTIAVELGDDYSVPPHLALALVELIINQVTVINQLPNQQQLESRFVYSLLFEPITDEAAILRQGQTVGIDLTIPRAVLLIDASEYILGSAPLNERSVDEHIANKRAQAVIAHIVDFFHLPHSTICTYIGNGEVVVLKASSTKDLSAWTDREEADDLAITSWANLTALKRAAAALLTRLRRDVGSTITIGIGRYHPGIDGLPRSYQDARAALSLGRHVQGPNRVHCLDALGIAAFVGVSDVRTKIDLAAHLLSPLDQDEELMLTLHAFFTEDCCALPAATRLGIHRNTLSYRLDKIASLTGLDPHRFDDAVQIRLALVLRALQNGSTDCANAQHITTRYTQSWANA